MTKDEAHQNWLEARKIGIGGSDIAAILGLSPWRTPYQIWLDKTSPTTLDTPTLQMEIGTELENLVATLYERETGRSVQRYNTQLQRDVCVGNIDRLVIPEGAKVASHKGSIRTSLGLECKTSSTEEWDEVPVYYQTQVQWYMGLTDCLTAFDIPVLFLGWKKTFRIYRIERDQRMIDAMQTLARKWWQDHVIGNIPPEAITYKEAVQKYVKSAPRSVDADDSLFNLVNQLKGYKEQIDELENLIERSQAQICEAMGDAEILYHDGQKIASWKTTKDTTTVNYKQIVADMNIGADILDKYTTIKPGSRRFILSNKEKKL